MLLGGLSVLYVGSFIESTWTGSLRPCERAADADHSTFQDGVASMQWFPPAVHCRFASTASDSAAVLRLPPSEKNEFASFGIAIVGAIVLSAVASALVVLRVLKA